MTRPFSVSPLSLTAAVFAAVVAAAAPAMAADMMAKAGAIMVHQAWARASAGMAKAGAAFMTLDNQGTTADRMVAAKADVAAKVELHTHIKEGEVMRMRQVDAIEVPAGAVTLLQPGGYHVMFIGLKAPLKEGTSFPLTLVFETSGEATVEVEVRGAGAMDGGMDEMKH